MEGKLPMATKKKSKASRKRAGKPKSKKSGKRAGKKAVKHAKPTRTVNAAKAPKRAQRAKASGKRQSGLDAAARVLKESGKPMKVKAIVETMLAKGYWRTSGKTPSATIYSAIIREIAAKAKAARFKKTGRGSFALSF